MQLPFAYRLSMTVPFRPDLLLTTPIFLGLAFDRWRIRIFDLQPMARPPRAIGRTRPLANNTLATELARLAKNNSAVLIQDDAHMLSLEQFGEQCRVRSVRNDMRAY
jgi:hypothetical protein